MRIIVVGGYGGFGGRLSRRLAESGHMVLVAGRSLAKAERFCKLHPGCSPRKLDRTGDIAATLAVDRPNLLIDAAGPFQGSDYRVPRECIAAGAHYIDLADARQFVTEIGQLDADARAAGVAVIAGASSVPALSQAVVEQLSRDLDEVTAVEIAITASSKASAGASVAAAILGGAGKPLRLWRGRRWVRQFGWQSMRAEDFTLATGKTLGRRLVALADVPDLGLLPDRIAGVSTVSFRAGTESRLGNLALWSLSWAVRGGLVGSLASWRKALIPAHRATALWGGDRSGMVVRLFGVKGTDRVERRWTLIAERGDGPEIPTLAAVLLAERLTLGRRAPGARDAGGLLTLEDFRKPFAELAVTEEIVERPLPPPLYARAMGRDFAHLDPALRSIHDVLRDKGATGEATVTRGKHPLARLIASVMRFPPAGGHRLHVHFAELNGVERWTRDFGGHCFTSVIREGRTGCVIESFGPLRFHFQLQAAHGGLTMALTRWSLGPLPLPAFLAPRSPAREWEEEGRFHFDVPVTLPLIGPVVHYRGWLQP